MHEVVKKLPSFSCLKWHTTYFIFLNKYIYIPAKCKIPSFLKTISLG